MNGHVYRNQLNGMNDDGVEFENEGICCRVWCNIFKSGGFSDIGISPVTVGPLYIFRNVLPSYHTDTGTAGVKEGSDSYGFVYFYHNSFAVGKGGESVITDSGSDPRHHDNEFFRNNIFGQFYGGYIIQYNVYGEGILTTTWITPSAVLK